MQYGITAGRTYAAFDKETTLPLIGALQRHKTIADPMAGFGTLMNFCSEMGISTFNIEYNPPTYLWGVLNNPKHSATIIQFIDQLLHMKGKLPKIKRKADISDAWFSPLSQAIISDLFELICDVAMKCLDLKNHEEIALAVLMPFVGRLSCHVPGNIVANVKQGGICLYTCLSDDFDGYLVALRNRLSAINRTSINKEHEFVFGNLITIKLERKFSAFITSPPYPNSRDYFQMFAPENACLSFLKTKGQIRNLTVENQMIGSVLVSQYAKKIDYNNEISSKSARHFIDYIADFEGKKQRSKYDNAVYYVPYFSNYFYSIQQAYRNFTGLLTDSFEGYVVVTNNTARNIVIPVAQSIVEMFHELNVEAKIIEEYTRELSHVGTINPRVKGFKARHMEYTIKVWRN